MMKNKLYMLMVSSMIMISQSHAHIGNIYLQYGLTTYDSLNQIISTEELWIPSYYVAMEIAAYHIMNDISDYVPVVTELKTLCPALDFNFKFFDFMDYAKVAVQNIMDPLPHYSIGLESSSPTVPLAVVTGALNIPQTSFFATSKDLDNVGQFPYFSRTIPSDAKTAEVLADLIKQYKLNHVGMFYVEGVYGAAYRDALDVALNNRNITLHSRGFSEGVNSSVALGVNALNALGINVIVVLGYGPEFVEFCRQAVDLGMTHTDRLLIFADSVGLEDIQNVAELGTKYADAMKRQQRVLAFGGNSENAEFVKFKNDWSSFDNDAALKAYVIDNLPKGATFGGNSLNVSYNQVNVTFPSNYFSARLSDVDSIVPFAYDAVVAAARALCFAHSEMTDTEFDEGVGEYVAKTLWENETSSFPFKGISGTVKFEASTHSRLPSTVNYLVQSIDVNSDSTVSLSNVAKYTSSGTWDISNVTFRDGTSTPPLSVQFDGENLNQVDPGLKYFGFTLLGVVEALCIGFIVWVMKNRKSHIVMKSQPQFLIICLVGVMISSLAILTSGVDDGDNFSQTLLNVACNGTWWLWSTGTTIVYAALITKMYRIHKIFVNPTLRTLKITNIDLYWRITFLLAISLVILIVWVCVRPMAYVRYDADTLYVTLDRFGNVISSYGECRGHYDPSTGDYYSVVPFTALIVCYHFLLLGVTTYLGFKVRNIDTNFQESTYLFIASGGMLQLYLLAIPIYLAISPAMTSVRFLVVMFVIAVNNLALVLLIMVPKVINVNNPSSSTQGWSSTGDKHSLMGNTNNSKLNGGGSGKSFALRSSAEESVEMPAPSLTFEDMFGSGRHIVDRT